MRSRRLSERSVVSTHSASAGAACLGDRETSARRVWPAFAVPTPPRFEAIAERTHNETRLRLNVLERFIRFFNSINKGQQQGATAMTSPRWALTAARA